ncbi:MAG: UDP-N-acetylglucosamine 2-epimerase (non-hydrolyzing) [Treponema sp.]|jgi:UDP-GlcNAc3NAcA epimerase|nr:UDP-N-acetylglucosamine 2-epimerase (non-hydrolyzing) [Treponema sp.]
MKILTIIGARPQFIKAAVLSRYIRNNPSCGITETLLHTGQHYDQNMSDIFFTEMEIPQPDINLCVGSGSHGKTTGLMLEKIEEVIIDRKPDTILVYGDTNSTLSGTLAASKLHVPVAHVEAGLRSFMMAMPEEQNRRLTDHLSTWLFCPTQTAVDNLTREGILNQDNNTLPSPDNKCVIMTGDIMYDASIYYRNKSNIQIKEKDFILLTIHRAENTDDPVRLTSIVNAVNSLSDYKFIFPVHPRTRKVLEQQKLIFNSHVKMIEPVGYLEMIAYESACTAILTDSGGVQKEAYFFNKPCITMRDSTEWVELVTTGWNTLTGADTKKIITAVKNLHTPEHSPALYGDGNCAEKICDILKQQEL